MKLALCLFGQARYLECEHASNLYKEFIINKHDVDIYGHTWIAENYIPSTWNDRKQPEVESSLRVAEGIKYQYPGIKLYAEPQRSFDDQNINKNNIISQIYSINAAVDMIDNPSQYQFILLVRYDLLISRFQPLDDLGSGYYGTNRHSTFADQLLFLSPEYIKSFKMYEKIKDREDVGANGFSIEQFKLDHFRNTYPGVPFLYHDFTVGLIRNI